ncbi:hypothetical protein [Dokdonella fugitiva]|uniref:Uncharacterized protein n=1 Tax=Dokdonella fugitiva TaxID=328517 RepID=A0A4R2I9R9_9GAMM|nr:hypothetical protein [Dokdonella fugitiva]TCO40766.1 hypothetical protein EV148_104127 [Dokdonella fugitiva]
MSKQLFNGDHASLQDIPTTMKAAAADVLAEATAARHHLRDTAAQLADDMRSAAQSMQVHARRARVLGTSVARDAMETGAKAGAQAWREARRHAVEWGGAAVKQARTRPAAVLVGVAVIGAAIGFWLWGASRRATTARATDASASTRTRGPDGRSSRSAATRKSNGRSGGRRSNSTTAPPTSSAH